MRLRGDGPEGAVDVATCATCHGTIDAHAYEIKAKVWARLHPGEPVPPPRRCTECAFTSLLRFAFAPDEEESET